MKGAAVTIVDGIEKDLTEHGLAFLTRSISSFGDEDSARGPLFAVVDVAVAIEALLKARLAREHWSLLLSNPDSTTVTGFNTGQAHTVTPGKAISRLEKLAGVKLQVSTEDIDEIIKLRNRTVHFTVPADEGSIGVRTSYGRALNAALAILENEFQGHVQEELEQKICDVIEQVMDAVGEIESLVEARMASIASVLSGADFCLECPRCGQVALTFSAASGEVACAFCRWRPKSPEEGASEYLTTAMDYSEYEMVQDGERWPIWECPECSENAVVPAVPIDPTRKTSRPTETSPADFIYACFNCAWNGSSTQFSPCVYCETQLTDDGEYCHVCFGYLSTRD